MKQKRFDEPYCSCIFEHILILFVYIKLKILKYIIFLRNVPFDLWPGDLFLDPRLNIYKLALDIIKNIHSD